MNSCAREVTGTASDHDGAMLMTTVPKFTISAERPASAILAVVERMARDWDAYDLDRIDGEFLWLWCHREVLPLIDEMRTIKESGVVSYQDDVEVDRLGFYHNAPSVEDIAKSAPNWWPFVDQVSWLAYERFLNLRREAAKIIPSTVVGALLDGKAATLRPSVISLQMHTSADEPDMWFVLVLVHSSTWNGGDVEQAIETAVAEFGLEREDVEGPPFHRTDVELFLVTEPRLLHHLAGATAGDPVRLPCIGVLVPIPLCSPGGVGREYDAVVRAQNRWHLALPGATATRQEKEVAVRTWSVGLLLGHGNRFGAAMRRVSEAGRLADVSQSRFGIDRRRLVERVPEARPFLMQRRGRDETLQTA